VSGAPVNYVRHTGAPAWGVGVLVAETRDQVTYLFADGVKRMFKVALVEKFLEPAQPDSDEDRERLARGVNAGGIATPIAINLELEAEIRKNPEDPGPYIVYADWLQQRKDPRGELIAVQEHLSRDPDNRKLRSAEQALFSEHGNYLMPQALHAALRAARRGDDPTTRCSLAWQMGFIERARIAKKPRQQLDLLEVVTQLAGHPSAAFLRELVLGPLGGLDGYDYAPMLAALASVRLPFLESLVIGDFTSEHVELRYTRTGDVSRVFTATPNLQSLTVRAGDVFFETAPQLAKLRRLRVFSELAPITRDVLFAAQLPELESLELGGDRVKVRKKDIDALAANASLEKLRELIVRRTEGTQTVLNALIGSPLLERLDTLVLADGDLGDKAVAKLERHAAKFSHLATLDLSGNPLSPASALTITRLVGAVATPRATGAELTEAAVLRRTSDPRNAASARELADATKWITLGRDARRVWGEYEGRDHYYVFAHTDDRRCGCSCGSPRNPCKHALALLLLAARNHAFPQRPPSEALLRQALEERPRYWSAWE
jgi:uncharacterized protein (TIGR02996 family)